MIKEIVDLFSPGPFGGAEQVVLQSQKVFQNKKLWLIKELRNPIPCEQFIQRCKDENIEYQVFESRTQFDIKLIKKLQKSILDQKIKIVHSHGLKANFCNAFLSVKKVATQHGLTSHNIKVKVLELIEHFSLFKMDKVICVSQQMYDHKNYPKKEYVPNFLAFEGKKINYLNHGDLKLIFVGRLSLEKGIKELIQVVSKLDQVHLTVIGDGEFSYLFTKPIKNINFLGFQKNIVEHMQNADALIMPSYREGMPMTLIEATALGLPVIASNVGAIPSLVKKNGILFSPQDKLSMKEAINHFITHRREYNQNACEFAKDVKKKYSLKSWSVKMQKIYQSL